MFVITYDNQVILGPMRWNKIRFENVLAEEHELNTSLPSSEPTEEYTVTPNCKIYPVQGTPDPAFNPTIEFLHGPFWEFRDGIAYSSYQVESLPIDAVKNALKARTAAERYKREVAGTTVNVQGTDVFVSTSRENRNEYIQQHQLLGNGDTIQWKFNDVWLSLSKSDLLTIANAINTYVQAQFTWEADKVSEIDACTTPSQLAAIEIEPPVALPV